MEATASYRPDPEVNYLNKPYWDACARHELVAQRCRSCGTWFAPADAACTHCFSTDWSWERSAGRGTLYSFSAMHRVLPGFPVPNVLGVVELDEGFAMFTNIVECDESELRCDMRVEVVFEDVREGYSLPLFRPEREARP